MPDPHRLTALAMARALLPGPRSAVGLAGRLQACLGVRAGWHAALADRLAVMPGEQWQRLAPRTLAAWIERQPDFTFACGGSTPPRVHRHLLLARSRMVPPPLGLHECLRPDWPDAAALADGLGLAPGALWRLTLPSARQRRAPLAQQHYRFAPLAKRSGGWRLLEVPHGYLMQVQRRLLDRLLAQVPPHEAACAFARERSLLDHARAHAGQAVVLSFDLRDFFASVRASRVHALFGTLGYPEGVCRALTALTTVATPEPVLQRLREDGRLDWRQAQSLRDAHLPQGAPTSPALANLCAFRLDLRLDGLAHALGARYTRYADDLVFSGGAHLQAARDRVETWVGRIAREEGFALNHCKTRCMPAGRRQAVCKVVVNRRANLPRDEFDRLKALLHACARDGASAHNRDALPHWREHLEGRVAWAAQLNARKAGRLKRLLQRIDWQR